MPVVWVGRGGRGPGPGRGRRPAGHGRGAELLTEALERLLRPVLEAAIEEARRGAAATPPVTPPRELRPVLHFRKPSGQALAAARRALDGDDDFRARVAAGVTEAEVGQVGWRWLTRAPGWEQEVAEMRAELTSAEEVVALRREVEDLRRRLEAAEQARERAEATRERAEADAAVARDGVATERRSRREAEERVVALVEDVTRLSDERAQAVRELKDLQAEHSTTRRELREAQRTIRSLQEELAGAGATPLATDPPPAADAPPAIDAREAVAAPDRAALGTALARAAGAIQAAGGALAEAARAFEPGLAPSQARPDGGPGSRRGGRSSAAAPTGTRAGRRAGGPQRRPARLPPPLVDGSAEAAEHLVRLPGAVVLVDGYNVSMRAWPAEPIDVQRRRLVAALDELHARTGAEPVVVFDGVTEGGTPTPHRHVRVRFTDASVEADDVVVGLVDEVPPSRPVVVVSSDEQVRVGAAARGANVVGSEAFLVALRR